MAIALDIVVNSTTTTVEVVLTGGILTTNDLTVIDGFITVKGAGNVAATIEAGDYISGWISDVYVHGKVLTIPVNDISDVDPALQGEILS